MATKSAVVVGQKNAHATLVKWLALTNATSDVGSAVELHQYRDRSVQVVGTFGAAGSVTIEGSNDGGTTWAALSDPQGNALAFTATKIEAISEVPALLRPRVTAGDGTTSLDVYLFAAGSLP